MKDEHGFSVTKAGGNFCSFPPVPASYDYSTALPEACLLTDYIPYVISCCDGMTISLEDLRILWQR